VKKKNASDTSATRAWSSVWGWLLYRQACCWEVASSEAKSSKHRGRRDKRREEKRGRGVWLQGMTQRGVFEEQHLQIIYSDYFCALHFDINIYIIHDDHTHKICHTHCHSLSLSRSHTHTSVTHTHTNLNTNYLYIQIRLNIDFLGEGNATIKQSLLTNC
jgi:hypothetical protein